MMTTLKTSTENQLGLDEYQQTFFLSMLSNADGSVTDFPLDPNSSKTAEEQLADALAAKKLTSIESILDQYLQDWSLVWGPAVHVSDLDCHKNDDKTYNGFATNTVFIVQNGSDYVVSVAGTTSGSNFDEMGEDGIVAVISDWSYGGPDELKVKISSGTAIALGFIHNELKDPNEGSLDDFFKKLNQDSTITFTGHSLGGALSPAMALSFYGSQLSNSKNYEGPKIRTYPTAGPDIGNADYMEYLNKVLPPSEDIPVNPWMQYNCKISNSIDMVPQAWANTDAIATLYGQNMATPGYVDCVLSKAIYYIKRLHGEIPYAMDLSTAKGQFQGTFLDPSEFINTVVKYDCATDAKYPLELCQFLAEVLYQHVDAYIQTIMADKTSKLIAVFGHMSAGNSTKNLFSKQILGCE
ncbi:hypothetical protein KFE98_15055 [bacterium SCSIO 12741]|nr:hypothetical protein KFE98_15055 [bacterium SCSIO 12741]